MMVKTFDAYPIEILNQNAKSWQICIKTNKTSSSHPNCCFGPGFFRESGFDGLN